MPVRAGTCVVLLVLLAGCSTDAPVQQTQTDGPGRSSSAAPSATVTTPVQPGPSRTPRVSASATSSPLSLPSGPATRPGSPKPPAAGSLATVDWARWDHRAACPRPEVGAPVAGDLDGDRIDEVAVPLTCPDGRHGTSSVLVYAGDAAAPRLVGDALPPAERAEVQGVQVRDGHLVVGALAYSGADRSGEPDTAVTTRWVVQADRLVRTDRWEDPANVLEVDEGR